MARPSTLAPSDRTGSAGAQLSAAIRRARREASEIGVTRLADVTGLDDVGVPVFQAIRPLGRTVCVHQGKGFTADDARIGALMEALECSRAETFEPRDARICRYSDLPAAERAPSLDDFATRRGAFADDDPVMTWVRAERAGGGVIWAPADCVGLDYDRWRDARLDRTSVGLGARGDLQGALLKGLTECLERDAETAWSARPDEVRLSSLIEPNTIRHGWFVDLYQRLRRQGFSLRLFQMPALIRIPAVLVELEDQRDAAVPNRRSLGLACRLRAEAALAAAVHEAAQSRITLIAAARDDILDDAQGYQPGQGFGVAPPAPLHLTPLDWDRLSELDRPDTATFGDLVSDLTAAGYVDTAWVELSPPGAIPVVKVFAPGLGAFERGRRAVRTA